MEGCIRVSEVFGPTFQGEGPSLGQRAAFIRLGGCNLTCDWCDTPYTWDWTGMNGKRYAPDEELEWWHSDTLVKTVCAMDTPLVVITGGEPLLQQRRMPFVDLVGSLLRAGKAVEVETNGTVKPEAYMQHVAFNCSPKLANNGQPADVRIVPDAIGRLEAYGARFKFVCRSGDDIEEMLRDYVSPFRLSDVSVMPEGRTQQDIEQVGKALAAYMLTHPVPSRVRLTTRLQVLLWGDERGH